jgi:hypothetical protein
MLPHEVIEAEVRRAGTLDESVAALSNLLNSDLSVWTDGSLYYTRQLVDRIDGLRLEIFAREHPPPHFHVSGGDIDATFSLVDGSHLQGRISGRDRARVEWWYQRSRSLLIRTWNETRPANCPVGPG